MHTLSTIMQSFAPPPLSADGQQMQNLMCLGLCHPGLNLSEMHSNSLLFFIAGFETVSTVLSFVLFALAANEDCLRKAREEVDEKIGKVGIYFLSLTSLSILLTLSCT